MYILQRRSKLLNRKWQNSAVNLGGIQKLQAGRHWILSFPRHPCIAALFKPGMVLHPFNLSNVIRQLMTNLRLCVCAVVCVFFHPKNMISSIFLTGYLLFLFYVQTGFVVQITNIKLELDGHTSLKYRFTCPHVLCKTTL